MSEWCVLLEARIIHVQHETISWTPFLIQCSDRSKCTSQVGAG